MIIAVNKLTRESLMPSGKTEPVFLIVACCLLRRVAVVKLALQAVP
jgi:hypothetical protein